MASQSSIEIFDYLSRRPTELKGCVHKSKSVVLCTLLLTLLVAVNKPLALCTLRLALAAIPESAPAAREGHYNVKRIGLSPTHLIPV